LKIKIRGHHFDAIEVIKAESQAVLNSLTEHDFQDAFKIDRSAGNGAYVQKVTTLRVMVTSRPKLSFWRDDSTSPRNYGYTIYFIVKAVMNFI
jgi:hypothetical protein